MNKALHLCWLTRDVGEIDDQTCIRYAAKLMGSVNICHNVLLGENTKIKYSLKPLEMWDCNTIPAEMERAVIKPTGQHVRPLIMTHGSTGPHIHINSTDFIFVCHPLLAVV